MELSVVLGASASAKAEDTSVRGLHVRYYTWDGRGPTVILLHPSRGYARMWDFVVPYLIPEFQVIALDQRGHGDTSKPATGYAGEDFAQDLGALLDQMDLVSRQVFKLRFPTSGRASPRLL